MNMRSFFIALAGLAASVRLLAQPTVDFVVTNTLLEPFGVAVDSANRVFLTDATLHQVFRYDPDNGAFTNIAGVAGQSGTNNGPGFFAKFSAPKGVAVARNGLVVSDSANHSLRFLWFTNNGVAICTNFSGTVGAPGYVDGPIASAQFNSPGGLASDEAGNIFIADTKNNAIRRIGADDIVSTVATNFFEPLGIAVGEGGRLFVADTRNHAIKVIETNGAVTVFAGSGSRISGSTDSYFAEESLFSNPGGLLWLGGTMGLLVTDTGNHTIRRVYFDPIIKAFFPELSGYSVSTYSGFPGSSGFVDGVLSTARFDSPLGLARDTEGGLLLTDMGNHALRRIQTTQKKPRVVNPVIGYVEMVFDPNSGSSVSKIKAVEEELFNNDVVIAIRPESSTVTTLYTAANSPGLFEEDTVPVPDADNALPPPPYRDGMSASEVPPTMIQPRPDLTIKAISTASGRRPSDVVKARFQFKVAPPVIFGDNPASFVVTNITQSAEMWYTIDGTDPTNGLPSLGPVTAGEEISLRITNVTTFKIRAYKSRYQTSDIATKVFSPTDFQANRLGLGFDRGEASSLFLATPGQRFYAPVTLSVLPSQLMFTLQFNLILTNNSAAPAYDPSLMSFQSMLERIIPGSSPPAFEYMRPSMFLSYRITGFTTNASTGGIITNIEQVFTNLYFLNTAESLLGVGWVERFGETNLYDTAKQQVITYSRAHDTRFLSAGGKVVLGAFAFTVPNDTNAIGKTYRIQAGRPSATSDGIADDVYIEAGEAAGKNVGIVWGGVDVGQLHYRVGDVAPFRWFNAGDFGDTNLLNNDVVQIFQSAIYGVSTPAPGSDFFDAMDTSNGTTNGLLFADSGDDTAINNVRFGDGSLNVDDVFVAFRRSLDPWLTNYARFWSNGVLQAAAMPNLFRGAANADLPVRKFGEGGLAGPPPPPSDVVPVAPAVVFSIDSFQGVPGQTVTVPLRASVSGDLPIRTLLLSLSVVPLDGAPPITTPVRFTPSTALGGPTFTAAPGGPSTYAATWLSTTSLGLTGDAEVGALTIEIPRNADSSAAYAVRISRISGSPNGIGLIPQTFYEGLITLSNRKGSSLNDWIPDEWRLRFFGSVSNRLATMEADADGDGVPNWAEFVAGTIPTDQKSRLELIVSQLRQATSETLALRWQTVRGKQYVIESSPDPAGGVWTTVATGVVGSGRIAEIRTNRTLLHNQFFRIRILE
jgi:hypothetical protein